MARDCIITNSAIDSKIIAQQLFLGASINGFNFSLGWNGTNSSLSVQLVNDFGSLGDCNITSNPYLDVIRVQEGSYDQDNHYYNCLGNDCYTDERGLIYNPDRTDPPGSREKRIPGKVYHYIAKGGDLVSRYWRKHDPGFFGAGTLIDPNGVFNPRFGDNNTLLPYKYNIIGVPVMFRYGYFTFGGIVERWDANIDGIPAGVSSFDIFNSSVSYTVSVKSPDSLLDQSKVILDKYTGSIFCSIDNASIGGPTNYVGDRGRYIGSLKNGNIPNVFNVYGFLESFGFGTANKNDEGIPLSYVLDSLQILTGTAATLGDKHAFSPFGRILAPVPLTDSINPRDEYYGKPTYANFGQNSFGVMNAELDANEVPRIRFAVDLSEIPRPPLDIRIGGQETRSVKDIISEACERTNRDWYSTMISKNGVNFIKIKTINRGVSTPINSIETTIKSLTDSGIPVKQSSFGQENNESSTPQVMLIGAPQKRLFQAKSLLLGYSNAHLVYHPVLKRFINYYRFGETTSDSQTADSDDDSSNNNDDPSYGGSGGDLALNDQSGASTSSSDNANNDQSGQPAGDQNQGGSGDQGDSGDQGTQQASKATPSPNSSTKDTVKLTISADSKFVDSIRLPLAYSTRNLSLCKLINGAIVTQIWASEQQLGSNFWSDDSGFSDRPVGGTKVPKIGNYNPAAVYGIRSAESEDDNQSDNTDNGSLILPNQSGGSLSDTSSVPQNNQNNQNSLTSEELEGLRLINQKGQNVEDDKKTAKTHDEARSLKKNVSGKGQASEAENPRYIPLYKYSISPFFGFVNDVSMPTSIGPYSDRFIRPVYLDTVTGQIVVMVRDSELPMLTFGKMMPLFEKRPSAVDTTGTQNQPEMASSGGGTTSKPNNGKVDDDDKPKQPSKSDSDDSASFGTDTIEDVVKQESNKAIKESLRFTYGITESELRAAAAGDDSYLTYCLGKLNFAKPDLFLMLVRSYVLNGKSIFKQPTGNSPDTLSDLASASGGVGGSNAGSSLGPGITTGNLDLVPWGEVLNMNFGYVINYDFYEDFKRLTLFVKSLHDSFYGTKYAVSLPAISIYRDRQYADIQLPSSVGSIGVYQGSGKLFYSYQITDGAWEEPGNFIDDTIVIGSPQAFNFVSDENLIRPILGYNSTQIKDYATEAWCNKNQEQRDKEMQKAYIFAAPSGYVQKNPSWDSKKGCAFIKTSHELSAIARYFACDKAVTASLDFDSLNGSEYINVKIGDSGREDAYGKRLIGGSKDPCNIFPTVETIPTEKLYIQTSCDDKIAFVDPIGFNLPKAIVDSPGINLAFSSTSFKEDPTKTVLSNVAAEDLAIIEYFKKYGPIDDLYAMIATSADKLNVDPISGLVPEAQEELLAYGVLDAECDGPGVCFDSWEKLTKALGSDNPTEQGEARLRLLKFALTKAIVPITTDNFLLPASNSSHQSINHAMLAPKKAHPIFAAIPLVDNKHCYGPWTNYPSLDDQEYVFPGIENTDNLLEQLIANVNIETSEEWAPWKFGGMCYLDKAMLYEMESRASYQNRTESGELTIAGPPIFSLGGHLVFNKTDQDLNQRLIKTWFSFPYHALEFLSEYEKFNNYSGLTISDMTLSVAGGSTSTRYTFRTYSANRGIYNKENSDRLRKIAKDSSTFAKQIADMNRKIASNTIKQSSDIAKSRRSGSNDFDMSTLKPKLYGTSPSTVLIGKSQHYWPVGEYSKNRSNKNEEGADKTSQTIRLEKSRFDSWIGLFEIREALNELNFNYNSQAGMSFDALYSPVSFYPTTKAGTYSISSRFTTTEDKKQNIVCLGCNDTYTVTVGKSKYPCPLCQKSKVLPLENKPEENNTKNQVIEPPNINFMSLNPIVMPTGEFMNPNAQSKSVGERSRHNISFIARDEIHIVDRSIHINKNLTKYDDDNLNPNPDWTNIDLSYKDANNTVVLNNHRFFALRGPMMLHGWGYDTEGYPVPNAADEPKELDSANRPKRFFLTSSGTNDLTKDGAFLPTPTTPLGDIIGKGWEKTGDKWVKTPSNKFYLNWGERPDLWPIGPIDLRWDHTNKIWVGGGGGSSCNSYPPYIIASGNDNTVLANFISTSKKQDKECTYKMVYGILEQDLMKRDNQLESYPTRAFLDDLEYGLKPLPFNTRRLIYIVDKTGYTAPRGAKILLRYNSDTGFYEPVSKQQYIVYGILNGNNTASVEFNYMPGYKAGEAAYKGTIKYDNPLRLQSTKASTDASKKGIFMYDNSKWNLINLG